MESLSRLVSESLARHGFDRPLDYRRLRWSRWFRCESHHSLLFVPSQPGVFALAEEIAHVGADQVGAGDAPAQRILSEAHGSAPARSPEAESRKPEAGKRMLAVTQFFEDDDMAFVLDRMLSRQNPMSARLCSGRYFVRFVVIEDQIQRRNICAALNQWIVSAAEKATGIGSHFATSLELTPATEYAPPMNDVQPTLFADVKTAENENVGRTLLSATADTITSRPRATAPHLDSGAATNIHCPSPFPSGF